MARLNEILVGRFNRSYQKLFGLKGEPPVATLAPEIMPSHVVFSGVEERYLQGWARYALTLNQAAVAAQTNGLQFRNPINSNVLAVFEKWAFVSNGVGDTYTLGMLRDTPAANDLTSTAQGFSLDSRSRGGSTIIGSSQANSPATVGTAIELLTVQQSVELYDIWTENQEMLLMPGDSIRATNNIVNSTTRWLAVWRERFLEEGERT